MNSKTIFIADSDRDDRMSIADAIGKVIENDIKIREAENGQDLVEMIALDREILIPALIMMEMEMAKISGLQALETIKADPRKQYVPIVMISNTSDTLLIEQAFDLGANHYVTKPATMDGYLHIANSVNRLFLRPFPF